MKRDILCRELVGTEITGGKPETPIHEMLRIDEAAPEKDIADTPIESLMVEGELCLRDSGERGRVQESRSVRHGEGTDPTHRISIEDDIVIDRVRGEVEFDRFLARLSARQKNRKRKRYGISCGTHGL